MERDYPEGRPCRGDSCVADIVWAQFEDSGRWHPFDLADDGNWIICMDDAELLWASKYRLTGPRQPGDGAWRAVSHYSSCPDAAAFRGGGK